MQPPIYETVRSFGLTAKLTDRRPLSSGLAAGVLGGGSVERLVRRAIYVKPV